MMAFTLRDIFGDSNRCRVVEVFVENPECVFSEYEVSQLAEVKSGVVTHEYITDLICNDIVISYGHDGNIEVYKLNINNEVVRSLIKLNKAIAAYWMNTIFEDCD